MDFKELEKKLAELKLPAFRETQIKEAYFQKFLGNWEGLSTLSKDLRLKLSAEIGWDTFRPVKEFKGGKGEVAKAVLEFPGGARIETVLILHSDDRRTVCVSSQAGCSLGCIFCATGQTGFKRNLAVHEIVEQVIYHARMIKPEKVTNIVFMGMGEPMLNYENVIAAVKMLNDQKGFGLGARHISISTIGLPDGIRKLAKENLQVNLAFSLHAPNDKLREMLCPVNKKYPIKNVFIAIDDYIEKTNRRVMIEYIMLENINDRPAEAAALAELLSGRKLCYVNLIVYNKAITLDKKVKLAPSSRERVAAFKEILEKNHITVTVRKEFGGGISAACGMLRA